MLGNIIKKLREEKGMLQKDLAKKLDISSSTVGMYEQGRREPDIETLKKLTEIFNVTMEYLLGLTSHPLGSVDNDFSNKKQKQDEELSIKQIVKQTIKELSEEQSKINEEKETLELKMPEGITVLMRATKELDEEDQKIMIMLMNNFLETQKRKRK